MTKPMTDERLAYWKNMIDVFTDRVSIEAGRCAFECTEEIRLLREKNERLKEKQIIIDDLTENLWVEIGAREEAEKENERLKHEREK